MRRAGCIVAAALSMGPGAWAGPVSERPEAVAVTIYRDPDSYYGEEIAPDEGLALVTETRVVDVPAGPATIVFRGVADTIVPQTAAIEGLPGRLLERNQDYDLLSPGSLIARWVGRPVELVRTNPVTGEETRQAAILRSGPSGVMLEIDGQLEPFKCGGPPERLVFDAPPGGLVDRPTLSILSDSPQAGRRTVRLTYLATGLAWAADYVARIRPDGRSLDLQGWITLENATGTTFAQAPTQVVAGHLSVEEDTGPVFVQPERFLARCWPMDTTTQGRPVRRERGDGPIYDAPIAISAFSEGGSDDVDALIVTAQRRAEVSELGDYKLYTLPEPTTVAARQTKQVLMLDEAAVPFERVYTFRMDYRRMVDIEEEPDEILAPRSVLRLRNEAARGLGKALPSGVVSVMAPDGQGGLVLVGERRLRDVAVGQPFDIELGGAMDIMIRPTIVESRDMRRDKRRLRFEVEIANGKPEPIVLEYRQAVDDDGFRLVSASRRHGTKFGDPMWTLKLGPGERQVLKYVFEVDW